MQVSGNLASEERLAWIGMQLESEGSVQIATAAKHLRVSEMTIRRDLQELEAMGLARRVRGGAAAVGPRPFAERHRRRAHSKAKIATKLVALLPSSSAIGFDASSTVMRLASAVEAGRDLTVLTNSSETFQALQSKSGVAAIITGGQLDPRTGSLVGPIANRAARDLVLSKFFMSAAAIDPALGASEACLEEAEVKRSMAGVAAEVILAVDSTKLNSRSVALSLAWNEISLLVTDLDPRDSRLNPYRSRVKIL